MESGGGGMGTIVKDGGIYRYCIYYYYVSHHYTFPIIYYIYISIIIIINTKKYIIRYMWGLPHLNLKPNTINNILHKEKFLESVILF